MRAYEPNIQGFALSDPKTATEGPEWTLRKGPQGVAQVIVIARERRLLLRRPHQYPHGNQWSIDKATLFQELRMVASQHLSPDADEYDLILRLQELESKRIG